MPSNYAPNLPTEPTDALSTPTTTIDKDMQQFYITILSIVAIVALSMVIIYAMKRSP